MPLKEPADNTSMLQTLLKGQTLSHFEHHLRTRVGVEDSEVPRNERAKYCMRKPRSLYMGFNTSVQQFLERQQLNDLNRYLLYFPEENIKQLD
jgi:hypothetical protein